MNKIRTRKDGFGAAPVVCQDIIWERAEEIYDEQGGETSVLQEVRNLWETKCSRCVISGNRDCAVARESAIY